MGKRRQWEAALVAGGLIFMVSAHAVGPWPLAVAKASAEFQKQCRSNGGRPMAEGVVHVGDLTGDGLRDYVVYGQAVQCDGAASAMSGDIDGAEFEVFLGHPDGQARRVLHGQARGVHYDVVARRLVLTLSGRACGATDLATASLSNVEECERPLVWQSGTGRFGLGPKLAAQESGAEASGHKATAASSPGAMPARELCAGRTNCYDGQVFTAQVTRMRLFACEVSPWSRMLQATVRLHNDGDRPIGLALRRSTAAALDAQGGRWTTTVVCGSTPVLTGAAAAEQPQGDANLVLRPGESRDATLTLAQGQRNRPYGERFDLDLSIQQFDVVAPDQVRLGREHQVSVAGLHAGAALADVLPLREAKPQDAARAVKGAVEALKSLAKPQ